MIIRQSSIIKLIIIFLPFMSVLTINLGFPLKVYELLILFLILTIPFSNSKISVIGKNDKLFFLLLSYFLMYLLISYFIGLYNVSEISIVKEFTSWRHSLVFAGLSKFFYILIIFIFLLVIYKNRLKIDHIIKIWIYGALLSSLYGLSLFVFLPSNSTYFRAITFAEGNFAGSFFILSIVLATYLFFKERNKIYIGYIILFVVSTLQTSSTIALINLGLYFLFVFSYFFIKKKKFIFIGIPLIIILIMFILQLNYIEYVIFEKLTSNEFTPQTYSRFDRINSIIIALEIFKEYPIMGSGLATYGFFFPLHENKLMLFAEYGIDVLSYKRIVNNVYLEILSENGIVGLIIFLTFLIYMIGIFITSNKNIELFMIFFGFFTILIAWNAYPTYTSLYHWVYIYLYYKIIKEESYDYRKC